MQYPANIEWVVGVDEVGRGPLAGPVTVGAVVVPIGALSQFRLIRESKQLSAQQREVWSKRIRSARTSGVRVSIASVSAERIDRIGIVPAIREALCRALRGLQLDPTTCMVLLDGGLHAPEVYVHQETLVHGDALETAIAMASVVAKVARDAQMSKVLHLQYPAYGFDRHKGYGTRAHYAALTREGLTPVHRRSFLRSFLKKESS